MKDIVERLQAENLYDCEENVSPLQQLAIDEIVRLRAELDEAQGQVQTLAMDAITAGCQAWENNDKALAAEKERDRLRDALKDALVSVLGQRDYKADRECATRIAAALKGDTP